MLKRLRFKNWRSLRDVVIDDLGPITVFIGANSSGKTNILDALHFLRYSFNNTLVEAIYKWRGYEKILTAGVSGEPLELEFSLLPYAGGKQLDQVITLTFNGRDTPFIYGMKLFEGTMLVDEFEPTELPLPRGFVGKSKSFAVTEAWERARAMSQYMNVFVTKRWQLLGENFIPPATLPPDSGPGNLYSVESDARNVLFILDFMRNSYPDLYKNLQDDLRWLLNHVDNVEFRRSDRETRMVITEKLSTSPYNRIALSISAGTARIIAMLTAFYALDMDVQPFQTTIGKVPKELQVSHAEMPGLVVIEEPDTALNPLLLQNFVEQLRNYVEGEHPRQVIMTTHNPSFLDLFKPEEVRVVERDEQGYTTVKRIPESVKRIWLEEYGLGEVWTTRSFGGVPE